MPHYGLLRRLKLTQQNRSQVTKICQTKICQTHIRVDGFIISWYLNYKVIKKTELAYYDTEKIGTHCNSYSFMNSYTIRLGFPQTNNFNKIFRDESIFDFNLRIKTTQLKMCE